MPEARLFILMGTYNAGAYLDDQVESIRRQSEEAWRLVVRDDGSSDDTLRLLARYAEADPRIRILQDRLGRLGPAGNFGRLMETAFAEGAGYLMLSDQDDVWHPDKVGRQMQAMRQAERRWGRKTPLLIHSDLVVAGEGLRPIHPSFFAYQGLRHEAARTLPTLLVQNFVTGCTLLANRPLLELALPLPKEAPMHDWWLALCAAAAGRIVFLPNPLVVYRQHPNNVVGALGYARLLRAGPAAWRAKLKTGQQILQNSFQLSAELRRRLKTGSTATADSSGLPAAPGNAAQAGLLAAYARLPDLPKARRLATVIRLRIHPQTLPRRLLFYLRLLHVA